MTPAEEFRAARAALGMTQQQLAEALGLRGKQTIYEFEKGRRNPREIVLLYLRTLLAKKTPAGARPASKLG